MQLKEIIQNLERESKRVDSVLYRTGISQGNEQPLIDYCAREFYKENNKKTPWSEFLKNPKYKERKENELKEIFEKSGSCRPIENVVYNQEKIRSFLSEDYFYLAELWSGKSFDKNKFHSDTLENSVNENLDYPVFFLGKIDKKEKIDGVEIYTIGDELFSSRNILEQGFYNHSKKRIVLRKYSAELFIWRHFDSLKDSLSEFKKRFVLNAIKYSTGVSGEKIDSNTLERASEKLTALLIEKNRAHELGHHFVCQNFREPRIDGIELSKFVNEATEAAADSFSEGIYNGELAQINKNFSHEEKLAFLSLKVGCELNIQAMIFRRELINSYKKLTENDSLKILEEARKSIWERSSSILEIAQLTQDYSSLIAFPEDCKQNYLLELEKIKEKEESEFKKQMPELKSCLEKILI